MGRHGGDADAETVTDPAHPGAPWDDLDLDAAERSSDAPGVGPVRRHAWKAMLLALLAATGVVLWRLSPSEAASGTVLPRTSHSTPAHITGSGAPPAAGTASGTTGALATSVAPGTQAAPGQASAGTAATGPSVHIVGAVKRPGLYRLTAGSRVNDAIAAAGGASKDADLAAVNLAAPLQDGQQLRVPKRGESGIGSAPRGAGPPGSAGTGPGNATSGPGTSPAVVRINVATAEELQELPGIGPALSARLIAFREQNGRFASAADLDAVPGIGPAMLAKLEGLVSYD